MMLEFLLTTTKLLLINFLLWTLFLKTVSTVMLWFSGFYYEHAIDFKNSVAIAIINQSKAKAMFNPVLKNE
jgi:hypothetical protein